MILSDTIAALATPAGTGGVAIVRVSGPLALNIAQKLTDCSKLTANTITPCNFYNAQRTEKLDYGLLSIFKAPRSFTGEDSIEFNCHGSYFLAQKILEQVLICGARLADPGEFTKRAFLAGKIDLTQAESLADMLNAASDWQLQLALKHLDGDVAKKIKQLRQNILIVLAELEAALDHPEEIPDPQLQKIRDLLSAAQKEIENLLRLSRQGLLIKSGVSIVLAGRTNAGKSSLFNALLKYERAIVTEIPGTTRDALEAEINLGGLRVTLIDTAGLRITSDKLERLGIERGRDRLKSADIILYLLDAAEGLTDADQKNLAELSDKKILLVLNKTDLPHTSAPAGALKISAQTGQGLDELTTILLKTLNLQNIDLNKNIYISSLRQQDKLHQAERVIAKALAGLKTLDYLDALSVYLKELVVILGEITGEETTDELLEQIFANFCVGK